MLPECGFHDPAAQAMLFCWNCYQGKRLVGVFHSLLWFDPSPGVNFRKRSGIIEADNQLSPSFQQLFSQGQGEASPGG